MIQHDYFLAPLTCSAIAPTGRPSGADEAERASCFNYHCAQQASSPQGLHVKPEMSVLTSFSWAPLRAGAVLNFSIYLRESSKGVAISAPFAKKTPWLHLPTYVSVPSSAHHDAWGGQPGSVHKRFCLPSLHKRSPQRFRAPGDSLRSGEESGNFCCKNNIKFFFISIRAVFLLFTNTCPLCETFLGICRYSITFYTLSLLYAAAHANLLFMVQ